MPKILVTTSFEDDEQASQTLVLAIRSLLVKNPNLALGVRIGRKYSTLLSSTEVSVFDEDDCPDAFSLAKEKGFDEILSIDREAIFNPAFPEGFFHGPVLRSVQLESDMQTKRSFWLGDTDKRNVDSGSMAEIARSFSKRHGLSMRYFDFGDFPVPEDPNASLKLENIILTAFDGYLFTSGYLASLFLSLSSFFYGLEKEREKMRHKKAGLADYFFNRGAFRKEEKTFADFFRKKSVAFYDGTTEYLSVEKPTGLKDFENYLLMAIAEEESPVVKEPKSK